MGQNGITTAAREVSCLTPKEVCDPAQTPENMEMHENSVICEEGYVSEVCVVVNPSDVFHTSELPVIGDVSEVLEPLTSKEFVDPAQPIGDLERFEGNSVICEEGHAPELSAVASTPLDVVLATELPIVAADAADVMDVPCPSSADSRTVELSSDKMTFQTVSEKPSEGGDVITAVLTEVEDVAYQDNTDTVLAEVPFATPALVEGESAFAHSVEVPVILASVHDMDSEECEKGSGSEFVETFYAQEIQVSRSSDGADVPVKELPAAQVAALESETTADYSAQDSSAEVQSVLVESNVVDARIAATDTVDAACSSTLNVVSPVNIESAVANAVDPDSLDLTFLLGEDHDEDM